MFTFAAAWAFLLLLLPFLAWRYLPPKQHRDSAVRVPFGDRLNEAAKGVGVSTMVSRSSRRWLVPGTVFALLVLAVARPQLIEPPIERIQPARDLLLLVDLSGSMQAEDFTSGSGETVSRLTAVKDVVGDFLIQREGDRVGLIVFGNAPFLQAPFTTDLALTRDLLDSVEVGMAGPKTALGDAIGLGIRRFEGSEVPAKTMIALTDGNDTASGVPPVEAARIARNEGIRIHTIAVGDPEAVGEEKLDEAILREVASATGGEYFYAADRAALSQIYETIDTIETREVNTLSYRPRVDLYFIPLILALVVYLAGLLVEVFRRRPPSDGIGSSLVQVDPWTGELEISEDRHVG